MRHDEDEATLLVRLRPQLPTSLAARDLRHLLSPAWRRVDRSQSDDREWLAGLTAEALARQRKPLDRALVVTWLDVFPDGPGAERLAASAGVAAGRHDWPYREAGRNFDLWDREGARRSVGRALLDGPEPDVVLRGAALTPGLYSGRLVQEALESIAGEVATASADKAARDCGALLDLIERLGDPGITDFTRPLLIRALLKPWLRVPPGQQLRTRTQRFILRQLGDPRTSRRSWDGFRAALVERNLSDDAAALPDVLRKWLVRASFELFFKVIGAATSEPEQWAAREEFWRHYLETDRITDARFVLGPGAERQAAPHRAALADAGGYGRLDGGMTPSHSALLMEIGPVVVAEWTHNGSCCFWMPDAVHRPDMRANRYEDRYMRNTELMRNAAALQSRKLGGKERWTALAHTPKRTRQSRGWHSKFARHIRDLTGISWPEAEW